jgi:hypothetical protein
VGDLQLKPVTAFRARKTRTQRQTFWRGCFPHHFKSEMTTDDANCFGAHLEYDDDLIRDPSTDSATSPVSRCYVTVDRVGTKGFASATVAKKLNKILKSAPAETWRVRNYHYVAFVWEGVAGRGEPNGFAIFSLDLHLTEAGRISRVMFCYHLAFIQPANRRRGMGQFLSAGIGMWLCHCKVYGDRVTRQGVEVSVSAEVYSPGGEDLGRIVLDEFRYIYESQEGRGKRRWLGWHIREVHDELEI